jgi:hypothetical protein
MRSFGARIGRAGSCEPPIRSLGIISLVAWLTPAALLFAQRDKAAELIESAKSNQRIAATAVQVAACFVGLACVWAGVSAYRKGFKISESKRVEGGAALGIAIGLALLGIGVAVGGILYGASMRP